MFLRKFLNGRISPLTIEGDGGAGGGGAAPVALTFDSAKPFVEQLPEKYRGDANFRDIKNFDGLADSFINAQKMLGTSLGPMPKDDDAKGWDGVYAKLGRPESADKYAIGKKADGSDYNDVDKAFQAKIMPVLHQAGISQRQFDVIRPAIDAMAAEEAGSSTKRATEYATAQLDGLKKEWGTAFDDNLSNAQEAALHYGGKELVADLNLVKDGKATGDNALLLKVFAKMGAQLREDGVIGKGGTQTGGAMTPADAKTAIQKLEANAEFGKIWKTKGAVGKVDGKDMTHDEAVKRMSELYGYVHPAAEAA